MTHTRTQGFSLIELILVLALVGVVALFTVPLSLSALSRSAVAQERDLFVSLLLRGARAAALANINEKSHGIHIDNGTKEYTLFEGTDFNTGTNKRTIPFTSDTISVTGGADIVFEQLSGNVANQVTLNIDNATQSDSIIIRRTGQIDW